MSLVDARLRRAGSFGAMDFATRNLYRSAIEYLARGSSPSELEIAELVVEGARTAAASAGNAADAERTGDPGYHLLAEGRPELERLLGFRPPPRLRIGRLGIRLGIGGYVGAILLVAAVLLVLSLWALAVPGIAVGWLVAFAVIGFVPATEVATTLVNRSIAWTSGATLLPGLELTGGVPESLRTLVAVPALLIDEASLLAQVEQLEVHHLAGASGDLAFALLLDGIDADQEMVDGDAHLLGVAAEAIAELNRRYGPAPGGHRFNLLHRRRVFNAGENKWMGWERKRGKLHELNRLLRGATDTTFTTVAGSAPRVPQNVRYVITLDADTRLPRDAALRLIGKMAHPLNQPRFCADEQRVVAGYAILQPRVTASLPVGNAGSTYQRAFSGPGGIDPYAAAVSDVYQDLFGEGSYTGKGIYDVDAFEASLRGRIPENALLSHDLFEGVFARAGLASDIEVVEEFPARYDVVARRQHRWTRGDWQLLPWLLGRRMDRRTVPLIGAGKMLDNLRRSLLAPFSLLALGLCWLLPLPVAPVGVLLVLTAIAIPAFLPTLLAVLPQRRRMSLRNHLRMLGGDLQMAGTQTLLSVALLPDQAWRMGDAIARTLFRLFVSRRHLLEWTTAAQASGRPRLNLRGFQAEMAGGTSLTIAMAAGSMLIAPRSWPVILPFAFLWLGAPALALWASRAPAVPRQLAVSEADSIALRLTARRTWRFFETFVTPADNMLPPDNFQEDPRPVVAHRTSPTNIGLYLLATVAARDFGWAGTSATVDRLEATIDVMRKLSRFKGHFFNWYGTLDLQVLAPAYVSSVDSGNLAGHLIAVANACDEWAFACLAPGARTGMADQVGLARVALEALPSAGDERVRQLGVILDEMDNLLRSVQATELLLPTLMRLSEKAARSARDLVPAAAVDSVPDLVFWTEALVRTVADHGRDRLQAAEAPQALASRLNAVAVAAREMALAMDFAFLLDPERKLLSIGYNVVDNRMDPSCYDLLASEARLASLIAIANGDVPTRHWFRLGRTATPLGSGSALISWSGSMFEYLMPSLVMRAPAGSLLEQTNRLVVRAPGGLRAIARRPLGHLRIRLQRPRPGVHLSVLQLRRARTRPEARACGEPGDRALCHRACGHGGSTRRAAELSLASPRRARRAAMASTRRWTSRDRGFPTARTSPSCATTWRTTRA